MDYENIYRQLPSLYNDSDVTGWAFFPEFRRKWAALLEEALGSETEYFSADAECVTALRVVFCGIDTEFQLNLFRMDEWYRKEMQRGKKLVFVPEKMTREGRGRLDFKGIPCSYDPDLAEDALGEDMKNIFACAIPSVPVQMRVVYGNRWVDTQTNIFRTRRVSLYRIQTDYVPAFMPTPFEVCLYLFYMDYCILKENAGKVKDDEMKPLLHIFRPSPMLTVKGLVR